MRTLILTSIFLALCLCTAQAQGEEAYSWTDSSGRTVYGSRPPKNADNVSAMKTKPLSRYSSTKLLKRLGWEQRKAALENKAKASSEDSQDSSLNLLQSGEVKLEQDDNGDIIACSVLVQNPSTEKYKDLNVAFEFADGTLVPAVGPDAIAAKSSAEYELPRELLPMQLQLEENEAKPSGPVVKEVVIHGTAE